VFTFNLHSGVNPNPIVSCPVFRRRGSLIVCWLFIDYIEWRHHFCCWRHHLLGKIFRVFFGPIWAFSVKCFLLKSLTLIPNFVFLNPESLSITPKLSTSFLGLTRVCTHSTLNFTEIPNFAFGFAKYLFSIPKQSTEISCFSVFTRSKW
jgi:hypothetical protein